LIGQSGQTVGSAEILATPRSSTCWKTVMLAPVRTVAPATMPVSLAEAKAHLRVDHDDQDDLITAQIKAATAYLDGWSGILGRALVTQTWRQDFAGFGDRLPLPLVPVTAIDSVSYFDGDNVHQTLDAGV